MMYENKLYHHGIMGQRWGIRRYQNADGSLTAAGEKRQLKDQKREAKKQAKADLKTRDAEARKQAVIRSGSMEAVMRYQSTLTNEELRKAVERIDMTARLSDIEQRQKDNAMRSVKRVADTVNTAANFATNSVKVYNVIANTRNTFTSKGTKWKTIPGSDQGSKKKKKSSNSKDES
jgi:hypothetical protein